jgi:hypothetical protein
MVRDKDNFSRNAKTASHRNMVSEIHDEDCWVREEDKHRRSKDGKYEEEPDGNTKRH